ncbi:MAG TPA: FprA family A-type flavoprotein [Dehalococcoidia bacterium]|nr:FprA family A-type flavoprotein [Dehalococcoidia bacterium]
MATIAEVAPDIYRINAEVPHAPITFSFFVIKDDLPVLVETGQRRLFEESLEAVKRVIDPASVRYIVTPHFESDECGALNQFLEVAPNAQTVCSPVGMATSFGDFAIREPLALDESVTLDLGKHRLGFLITPYVHQWESMLPYDATTGTVFTSDVFIQPGPRPAITDEDLTEEMLMVYKMVGIFPSRVHLNAALDKIEALKPRTLAAHHGSVIGGKVSAYIQALRDHDVTGLTVWNPMQAP